jgi:uncharacterized membrane protein (UPF0127 family)
MRNDDRQERVTVNANYRLQFDDVTVRVELAESVLEHLRGLRGRDTGAMLFRFSRPTRATVDTVFVRDELYLYFFDDERRLFDTRTLSPMRMYRPPRRYSFLLESFERLGLGEGAELPTVERVANR